MELVPPPDNPSVGNHVFWTAVVAWPLTIVILLFLFLFGYPRGDLWTDTLIVAGAIPTALVTFGVYSGAIHLLFRKHHTNRLMRGWLLHLSLLATAMIGLLLLDTVHGKA